MPKNKKGKVKVIGPNDKCSCGGEDYCEVEKKEDDD